MNKNAFKSEQDYYTYLQKGQLYFKDRYSLGNCYNSARTQPPMLIHLFEQGQQTNNLLERIVNLLEASANESSE